MQLKVFVLPIKSLGVAEAEMNTFLRGPEGSVLVIDNEVPGARDCRVDRKVFAAHFKRFPHFRSAPSPFPPATVSLVGRMPSNSRGSGFAGRPLREGSWRLSHETRYRRSGRGAD